MESTAILELKSEQWFHRFLRFLQVNKYTFQSSMIIGLLAHVYIFTNKLPNSDDLRQLFAKGYTTDSGRWALELTSFIFPDISMPWVYGMISIFLISIACCLIIQLFSVRNKVLQCLIGGVVISFPSLTGTFCYMFTSASYALAFLLSVSAAYYYSTSRKSIWMLLLAVIASIISTGIYQAYIAITASLLVLSLIQALLQESSDEKNIFLKGIHAVLFLIVSLGLYWIVSQIAFSATETGMNEYSQDALSFTPSRIVANVIDAYRYFLSTFVYFKSGIISGNLSRILHFVCIALISAEVIAWISKNLKKPLRIFLMLFLLGILPLTMNCIHLFISAQHIHTLVMYSFISIYILAAIVIENGLLITFNRHVIDRLRNVLFDIVVVCMSVVIMCNVYAANKAYLHMQLRYENYYAFCNSIIAQLQSIPEYSRDMEVAMIGGYEYPDFYSRYFSDTFMITGADGIHPNINAKWKMFEYYLGYDINVADKEKSLLLAGTEAYQSMPSYPDHGFVQVIDDTIVIKLPDQ